MTFFGKIRLTRILNQARKQMDLKKFTSLKFLTALVTDALVIVLTVMFGLDADTAGMVIALVSGGYLGSQGAADWAKAKLGQAKSNLGSRKLWMTIGTDALILALTRAGLDMDLAVKLIGTVTTLYFGARAAENVAAPRPAAGLSLGVYGNGVRPAHLENVLHTAADWPEKETAGDR